MNNYFVKGTCWSTQQEYESHQKDNCVDMTYAIFHHQTGKAVKGFYRTREEAELALQALSDNNS